MSPVNGAATSELLRVENLVREYRSADGRRVQAVSDVSLSVARGRTLGLVGESGCGKSSLGRAILQLPPPESGAVLFEGEDLTRLSGKALRSRRRRMQMVFQDPVSSLNPRRIVGDIVAEPLAIWEAAKSGTARRRVEEMLALVGFSPAEVWNRAPHELSGGQCQRVSLARAMILEPALLICDEPVSALDVSVQAQILNLLHGMAARFSLTMLFISHDLAVIRNIADRVAVMYLGKIVESGATLDVYERPRHPYTDALLRSVLPPGRKLPERDAIEGELPSAIAPPSGCRFRTRCPRAEAICAAQEPKLDADASAHRVACHFPLSPAPVGSAAVDRASRA